MDAVMNAPGFVDLHVHFREPGFPQKEDIGSGTEAARAGGFSCVCMMPNTNPAIDSVGTLMLVDAAGRRAGGAGAHMAGGGSASAHDGIGSAGARRVEVFAACAMTKGQQGRELVDFAALDAAPTRCRELTGHGVCGISEDGRALLDDALMEAVCREAKRLSLPIMDHCEDACGREAPIVARDIALCGRTGARFHLQHISRADSVALIRKAKAQGLPVTCETAPHYFALARAAGGAAYGYPSAAAGSEPAVPHMLRWESGAMCGYPGTAALPPAHFKMNPPIGTEADREAIIEGIRDGTIDCIATDHAPHEAEAKDIGYAEAANGIVGLETAFAVSYTALVRGGHIDMGRLIRLMSGAPAAIIGLPPGALGTVAIDTEHPFTVDREAFRSRGRATPFHGMEAYGRVLELGVGS